MRLRITTAATVAITSVVALAGCAAAAGDPSSTDPTSYSTDTINAAIGTDPGGFDPARARASDDYYVSRLLFDTLLRKDDDNTLVGGLAESWKTISASEYSFVIRDDATCSDGTPITATIVANSLSYFADPETQSPGRTLAFGGAAVAITADEASSTVTIALDRAWSDVPTGLTLPGSGIICPAGLADPEGLLAGTVDGAFSGPYVLTSAQPAVAYELTLRDDYAAWPEFSTPLDGVPATTLNLTPIADPATVATQLQAQGLDIGTLSDENINRFDGTDAYSQTSVSNSTTYLLFNERPGTVFADEPELRLAAAQAVDPEAFRDITTDGRGDVLTSVSSPNVLCVNTDNSLVPEFDPDAAASALDGLSIKVIGTNLLDSGNEYVAEMLRDAGADVQLSSVDNATWSTTTGAGGADWDLTIQGDINLMGTLTSSLLRVMGPASETGGRNKVGLTNDEGYAALTEAMSATDPDEKCAALQTAQESFLDRVDAMPLASTPQVAIAADGFSIRAFDDYLDPSTMRITK